MTASTSVHSNALNFMSCLKSGVDPRTGLYNVSISLPDLPGNDLRGPGMALGLSYSPLVTQDNGYGKGWGLQLTQYDPGKMILSLSTGETFKITSTSSSGPWQMEEQKLDTFHFYKQDDTHFRVVHKSGMVEILELRGPGGNQLAVPVQIYSASGHRIDLDYQPFSSTRQILRWIKDEAGQTLLSVQRNDTVIDIDLFPYANPNGGPLARFVMTLVGSDRRVARITLPTENQAAWHFVYGFEGTGGDHLCIKEVRNPAGGREEIEYRDGGHQFPASSGLPPLPRVTRHVIHPGLEQPAVDVRYTYQNSQGRPYNFLGAGLSVPWTEDGRDNLYKHLNDYEYACTETLMVDGEAVRSIERTYNRLHLLTKEMTTQAGNVKLVETSYNIRSGVHYKDQPADCQMPREIKTTWRDASRLRSETVSNTYDRHGNQLSHTRADGIVETSTWYPAEGADGCPEDPEGFVRHLKDRTTRPAPSAPGRAPTLCTRYRYAALPALEQSPLSQWLVPVSETLVQLDLVGEEPQLQQIRMDYINQPDDGFVHGRVQRRTTTLNGKSTISTYAYEKLNSLQLDVPVQQVIETLTTDFDGVNSTILRQQSLFSGQELLTLAQGVETRYLYDALNRLVRETVAPNTEFEATRQYQYTLCANPGDQVEQVLINARNITTRTRLDGLGRAVYEERDHVEESNPGLVRQTYAARYDAWNHLREERAYDWLDGREMVLPSHYDYDDWGQQTSTTDASGVESHQAIDPIGSLEHRGPIQRTWLQSDRTRPPVKVSGRSETWLNPFGKPHQIRSQAADGQVIGTQKFDYDGLGRCIEQIDPSDNITRFSYDALSRMISSTLPDRSVVSREYAPHSTAELPTSLNVQFPDGATRVLAGEQVFDGLQRLTQLKVGPRSEDYAYDGDRAQVKRRTTAAGETIKFDYNLLLTDQPVASRAPDEDAEFSYDRTSARLTRASNEQGVRTYDYDPLNRLRSERWHDNQGKVWQTLYVTSPLGRALKRTDFKEGSDPGQDTLYRYDPQGRLHSLEQGHLRATVGYNTLGQISSITTRDLAADSSVLTELEYDDQGREILRTLSAGNHAPRTLAQVWRVDGLLESRHLQQGGASLLLEAFRYDSRGRLTQHDCSGSDLPRDALGRAITRQIFIFDALDNLTTSSTSFVGQPNEVARFKYEGADRCQLTGITYTPPRATPDPSFTYDANGNLEYDERGHKLTYDSQGRLLGVEHPNGQSVSAYSYDSHDHLVTSRSGNDSEVLRFYQGYQLSGSVQDGRQTRYLHLGDQPLGQQQSDDPNSTLLLLTDANNSVLGESQRNTLRTAVYNAYGERHSDDDMLSQLAFNGEVREPDSGWYLLGNGYRAYNPGLMRFHSPDALSPFGAGGLNPYTYCLGNPIALRDPTGHEAIGWSGRLRRPDEDQFPQMTGGSGGIMEWVMVAVGVVFTIVGIALTIGSFGAALPVVVPVTVLGITMSSSTASAVATASLAVGTVLSATSTGASAYAAATGDEKASQVGMITGLVALPFDIVGGILKGAVKGAVKGASILAGASVESVAESVSRNSITSLSERVTGVADDAVSVSTRTSRAARVSNASNPITSYPPVDYSPAASVRSGSRSSVTAQRPSITRNTRNTRPTPQIAITDSEAPITNAVRTVQAKPTGDFWAQYQIKTTTGNWQEIRFT